MLALCSGNPHIMLLDASWGIDAPSGGQCRNMILHVDIIDGRPDNVLLL